MKWFKESVVVKDLSTRIKREVREGNLQIITNIVFFLSMASAVIILCLFINSRGTKFLVSEEPYFPELPALTPGSSWSLTSNFLFNHSICSNRSINLKDLIASKDLQHSMNDKELLWLASMVPRISEYPYNHTPKVAFMFLSRGRLPLAPLWERFFKGGEGLYSIYLHSSPKFIEEPPESSVFYKRRIPSKEVQWGKATMIDAERRLLANALLDFSNEIFVLLSETCIPLFNFTTIYNYLIKSNVSFVGSFDDPRHMGRGRYNKLMFPTVSLSDWRKGNQWFEVHRKIAIEIVSEVKYYPVFKNHCRPPCYMDEHYLPTLVTKLYPAMNSNRSITWVDWSRGGSHPTKFTRKDVSEDFLNKIRVGFNCTYNGRSTNVCFLFARKFLPSTLQPLLRLAPALFGFDP